MRFLFHCLLPALALTLFSVSAGAENPDRYLDKTVDEAIRSLGQPTGRMTMGSTELLTFERLELKAENGVITSSRRLKPPAAITAPAAPSCSIRQPEPEPEPVENEAASEQGVEEEAVDLGPAPVLSSRQMRRLARRTSGAVSTNNPAHVLPRMETGREKPSVLHHVPGSTPPSAAVMDDRRQYERPLLEVDRDKPSVLQTP